MPESPLRRYAQLAAAWAVLALWLVALHPPGERAFSVRGIRTPQPTPTATTGGSATLVFVGDVMLARSVGDMMAVAGDWTLPFARIASVTRGADAAFANLESVISDKGAVGACGYCFRADPQAMAGLMYAGFDVVSIANNHAHDYGPHALADSVARLEAAGITPIGTGSPAVREVAGTRVGFLAYTYPLDEARVRAEVLAARPTADVIVVSFHAGEEYAPDRNAEQERVYRAAVDAGADLVVGHHPHVVQSTERWGTGWIAYSLGNFVFDQTFSEATMTGLLLEATIRGGRIAEVATRSVSISRRYQPSLAPVEP